MLHVLPGEINNTDKLTFIQHSSSGKFCLTNNEHFKNIQDLDICFFVFLFFKDVEGFVFLFFFSRAQESSEMYRV